MEIREQLVLRLKGKVSVTFGRTDGSIVCGKVHENKLTDAAQEIIADCIRGSTSLSFIDIGEGGNIDPNTGSNLGKFVAPEGNETQIRKRLYRAPINMTKYEPGKILMISKIGKEDLVSNAIDEFALMTDDNRMFAHYIEPGLTPADPAKSWTKTDLLWMMITWDLFLNFSTVV